MAREGVEWSRKGEGVEWSWKGEKDSLGKGERESRGARKGEIEVRVVWEGERGSGREKERE